ncbi:MAG TPA: N-6 DNA methylase [Candidatus Moranbacteria bacterium]|nr:N-6 DNA methylase [Candidatus Moranbacteria bacterium]
MDKNQAQNIVVETLQNSFDKEKFLYFVKNFLNSIDESKAFHARGYIKDSFKKETGIIKTYERLGTYTDPEGKKIDILVVYLQKPKSIDKARTAQRDFVAHYLKDRNQKDAGLVAFVSPDPVDWRFSLVKMEYKFEEGKSGKIKVKEEFTSAKRWSFLVGANENSHTAQSRLAPIVEDDVHNPTLAQVEDAFNIEKVTREFFEKYRELFFKASESLNDIVKSDKRVFNNFQEISGAAKDEEVERFIGNFIKKLLGQVVFLYFLQKKGWFGVPMDKGWGDGDKKFLRTLFDEAQKRGKNYFNDYLEPLFYEALAKERDDDYYSRFNCKIPFLNGGLFDPISNYDWVNTAINLPDELFSNNNLTKEKDRGNGILDIFDRYNFTVKEDEPLEKEVAVDPEMLGKVFENLLEVKDRKSKGTYYTPREIVHYMCQESLVNYLKVEAKVDEYRVRQLVTQDIFLTKKDIEDKKNKVMVLWEGEDYNLDKALKNIKIVDPACGSGAFLVGMLQEIVKARKMLQLFNDKKISEYSLREETIQNCIYGVDIDPGAVEIAKLRLWLSLVVEEDDIKHIKPLPNLDYKIMQGNSLLEEFEGVKLFDEKLISSADFSKEKRIEDLKSIQNKLSGEYIRLHQENKLTDTRKIEINSELKKISAQLKKMSAPVEKNNNSGLFDASDEAIEKAERLKQLHKEFFETTQKKKKDDLKKQIERLEWELIEATLKKEGKISELKKLEEFKKSNTKPFFLWKLNFAEVFQEREGFDIVIANPPYVRQEEIKYKSVLQSEYQIYTAVSDLYTYFYEKGFELLKDSGVLTFITSNKFLRAKYGISLRNYLKDNLTIKNIINFGDKHMFDAITNTLIFIASKEKTDNNLLNFSDNIDEPNKTKFAQNELQGSEWTIDKPEVINLKKKVERVGMVLKNWKIEINYGLKTGYNEAFIINDSTREDLIKGDPGSNEIIKPIIRGRDIKRYCYVSSGKYLIVTHNGYKLENGNVIDAVNIDEHPSVKNHLNGYIRQLNERQDKGSTIYNLRDCAFMDDFAKEKIIWIELTNENKFAYSNKEDYLLAGAFFLVGESLKYLLSFLNSKLCRFYFSLICNSSGMATIQWKKFALEKVPVMKLSDKNEKPFVDLVDKILDITRDAGYLESKEKQNNVKKYERQIDQMFYNLYGLTEEEIRLVEGEGIIENIQ